MKKLLFIAFHDSQSHLVGVQNKVLSQCRAFSAYGYRVELLERAGADSVRLCGDGKPEVIAAHRSRARHRAIRGVLDKQRQLRDIRRYIRDRRYDACYIRYDFSDPGFAGLLKALRPRCGKLVLELPTYPYEDENRQGVLSRLRLAADRCLRGQLRRYVDFIVTFYTGYETLFGIPVLAVPNGFDFSAVQPVRSALPADAIHVIAVSSMRAWHGYERFIEGLRAYVQSGGADRRAIVLHLVGDGRELPRYRALTQAYGLQRFVRFEGVLSGAALDALYERCALGIDSLARHRSGIGVLSSLKSREYGAKGLPMINACAIDVLGEDFPYLMRVPADESPIDMRAVLAFYDRCFDAGKSRAQVSREIRAYVEARCSMERTLKPVVARMEEA